MDKHSETERVAVSLPWRLFESNVREDRRTDGFLYHSCHVLGRLVGYAALVLHLGDVQLPIEAPVDQRSLAPVDQPQSGDELVHRLGHGHVDVAIRVRAETSCHHS